jgi:hypothetical protein
MILMVTGTYPLTSAMKAVDVFMEEGKDPLPEYIKNLGFYNTWGGDGIAFYLLLDIEDGKVDEALGVLVGRHAQYMSVEGYKLQYIPLAKVEASMDVIGKEMPAGFST